MTNPNHVISIFDGIVLTAFAIELCIFGYLFDGSEKCCTNETTKKKTNTIEYHKNEQKLKRRYIFYEINQPQI